ncbi:MAG: oligosaccharide flippase family protein [Planctomycetota bacterium]
MISSSKLHNMISNTIDRVRGSSLKAKSARAAIALGSGTVVERGLRFVRNMILARILAPDQFGLMAIVMVVASVFEAFTEVGVKQSVIQNKRGADNEYLNVAWWFQAIRGLAFLMIAYLAAPWISSYYGKPELLGLLRVAFLAILFRGLVSPRAHVLEKEYRFGRAVFLVQGSGVLGTFSAIILAFMIQNVWALVIGFVAEFAIMCMLSYVIAPFKPTCRIQRESLAEMFKFARGVFGLPILTIIAYQIDVLVLGKVVTEEELGMYYLAVALVQLPIFLFSRVVRPILLPAFSQMQDDNDSLCRVILQISRAVAVFVIPFVVFMASCASAILLLAYGPEYTAVTIPCAMLCLLILVRSEGSILASAYFAVGQPHMHRRFVAVRAAMIVGFIYPAVVHFGLSGAAFVVIVSNVIATLIQVVSFRKVIDLRFSTYMRCYLPGLLLALPLAGINLLSLSGTESPFTVLAVGAVLLCVSFAMGIRMIIKEESKGKWDHSPSVASCESSKRL